MSNNANTQLIYIAYYNTGGRSEGDKDFTYKMLCEMIIDDRRCHLPYIYTTESRLLRDKFIKFARNKVTAGHCAIEVSGNVARFIEPDDGEWVHIGADYFDDVTRRGRAI